MFDDKQLQELEALLDPANVKPRKGPNGATVHYVEGWQVIDDANAVFGPGNWSRESHVEPLHDPALITDPDNPERGKVVAAYFAKVRLTVYSRDGSRSIVREGCGAARGFAKTAGEAMENALKAAETDATKRALCTFGYRFGLALYDTTRKHVGREPGPRQVAQPGQQPLDTGFEEGPRPTVSQRALAVSGPRRNGRMPDTSKVPV
jgi:recombination DNA repair RAD52 pathway protein